MFSTESTFEVTATLPLDDVGGPYTEFGGDITEMHTTGSIDLSGYCEASVTATIQRSGAILEVNDGLTIEVTGIAPVTMNFPPNSNTNEEVTVTVPIPNPTVGMTITASGFVAGGGSERAIFTNFDVTGTSKPVISTITSVGAATVTCTGTDDALTLTVEGSFDSPLADVVWDVDLPGVGTLTPDPDDITTAVFVADPAYLPAHLATGTMINISVMVTDVNGCTDFSTQQFTVYPAIVPTAVVVGGGTTVCTGGSVDLNISAVVGGFGEGVLTEYTYEWVIISGDPGATVLNDDQQTATFFPPNDADEGDMYTLHCIVTDKNGGAVCSGESNQLILTVSGPTEAALAPALGTPVPIHVCSGDDVASLMVVDIIGGSANYAVELRGRNVPEAIDETFNVMVNGSDIILDPVVFNNPKLNAVTLTYTIESVTDVNGCELAAPGGITGSVDITYDPVPNATATAQNATICSGSNAVIDVTTLVTDPIKFKWTANYSTLTTPGTGGPTTPPGVAMGVGAINDGPLDNTGLTTVTVTYTITPYTFGANGLDDGGAGDDCLLAPALTVDVDVEPEPKADAVDDDGDGDKYTETICSGGSIQTTVAVSALPGHKYLVDDVQVISGAASGFTLPDYTVADGDPIDPSAAITLDAPATMSAVIQYTIVPYTNGPDGIDDSGGNDDCRGTSFTIDVTVLPTPTIAPSNNNPGGLANVVIDAVNIDANPAGHMCSGSIISIPVTTNVPNIRLRWELINGGANFTEYTNGNTGDNFFSTTCPNTFSGNGMMVTLTDVIRQNLVFELTPEYDPDGIEGNGDECVGNTLVYRVRV